MVCPLLNISYNCTKVLSGWKVNRKKEPDLLWNYLFNEIVEKINKGAIPYGTTSSKIRHPFLLRKMERGFESLIT